MAHLFPGDDDEHGAVILAGISSADGVVKLLVREVHLAAEGTDYVQGKVGYRALAVTFIHRLITRARDQRLVYLAVHNHDSEWSVSFSPIDLNSHEQGYPALLQIARGMPVGALVFGRRSVQADLWSPNGDRMELEEATVVGNTIVALTPSPRPTSERVAETYDRQVRMFGRAGQEALADCAVAVVGLGGIGSLAAEYLARIGVRRFCLVDPDRVERSNLSRITGAAMTDADQGVPKIEVAKRNILRANADASVRLVMDDFAKESVAKIVTASDFIFLAADSMRSRLVFNAVVHQYLIPGVQLGAKIRADIDGSLLEVMSANRPVRPGQGCLWCNQLIDPGLLAIESKTDEERKAQAYGVEEPNPSVITLNAVAAAHAVNDFLLDYLGLRKDRSTLFYEHFHFLTYAHSYVQPRRDEDCGECSATGARFGRGDTWTLPCIED